MPITGMHRFRMTALVKYAIVLASGVAIGVYVTGPGRLERIAELARVDEINIRINNSFADPKPEAAAIVVDPTDARRANEDLDYLIAKRTGTLAGWEAFLAAHPNGTRATFAETEIGKLSLLARASGPAAVDGADVGSPAAKAESEATGPSGPSEAATLPRHNVCDHDRDCAGEPRIARFSAENTAFTGDSQSDEIRPQFATLVDSPDGAPLPPSFPAEGDPELRRETASARRPSRPGRLLARRRGAASALLRGRLRMSFEEAGVAPDHSCDSRREVEALDAGLRPGVCRCAAERPAAKVTPAARLARAD